MEIEFVVTKWVYAALCASVGGVISQSGQRNIRVGPSHRLNKCLVATTASRATGGVQMQLRQLCQPVLKGPISAILDLTSCNIDLA